MPFPILPAAIGLGSLAGSIFGGGSDYEPDPRYDETINMLLNRSRYGLSDAAEQAYLAGGSRQIGQGITSGREQIRRRLAAAGEGRSGAGAAYELGLQRQGNLARTGLRESLTMLDEQARSGAMGQLLQALAGKSGAQQFAATQGQADFGTPLGLSLYALFKNQGYL